MNTRRPMFGLVVLVAMIGIGYLVLTLTPAAITGYSEAAKMNPYVGYAYLGLIAFGGMLFFGVLSWLVYRLWRNTKENSRQTERRSRNPSELSSAERTAELGDNLQRSREHAEDAFRSPRLRSEIESAIAELEAKRSAKRLEIVAFGSISSGKSSLLNALAGREAFRTDVIGGTTTSECWAPWPDADEVRLVDTPGIAEVQGEQHGAEAAGAAEDADLVLFVVDGPMREFERALLTPLAKMEKRIVLCLNKADWYDRREREELLSQLREQTTGVVKSADIVAVRSRPTLRPQVRQRADGSQETVEVEEPPNIGPLADRLLEIVRDEGADLLLANLLMQSRGLVDEARERVLSALDEEADRVINRYMWAAGGVAAVNPVPLLDLAGGSAVTVKMVLDLAGVYKQKIDADTVIEILSQLGKNLLAMLGASAAAPALGAAVGSFLKTIPGVGTLAGGALQGVVQALVTRWIGRVFRTYYRSGMQAPEGIAELARNEWQILTRPDELRKLIALGREHLVGKM